MLYTVIHTLWKLFRDWWGVQVGGWHVFRCSSGGNRPLKHGILAIALRADNNSDILFERLKFIADSTNLHVFLQRVHATSLTSQIFR